jgi:hypothetical protein
MDTRYLVGEFIRSAYPHLLPEQRQGIEEAVLALSGQRSDTSKKVLAGCIPDELVATEAMRIFKAALAKNGQAAANAPPVKFQSSWKNFGTDEYLESEGVNIRDTENVGIRELLRTVEEIPNDPNETRLLVALEWMEPVAALHEALAAVSPDAVDVKLLEHAAGVLAQTAARIARFPVEVVREPRLRPRLKSVLLFTAQSSNPHFNEDHENSFHKNLSWGGPCARSSAADGLLNIGRGDEIADPVLLSAIHTLARDPVCHVRLQIVQNLGMMCRLDSDWAWSELEHVIANEVTRGVIQAALSTAPWLWPQDIPRTIKIAKTALARFAEQEGAGIAETLSTAETIILDIHMSIENAEADAYYADVMENTASRAAQISNWIARNSGMLRVGDRSNPNDPQHAARMKVLSFYGEAIDQAFKEIAAMDARLGDQPSGQWSSEDQNQYRALIAILDEVITRLNFASKHQQDDGQEAPCDSMEVMRYYEEISPLLDRLTQVKAAHGSHYLIEALERFIRIDPVGVFVLIAKTVRSAQAGGYSFEHMGAEQIVRIVETYLADHRDVFANPGRLTDLMDCLDIFVRAGWPAAQALTFRLAEIWR